MKKSLHLLALPLLMFLGLPVLAQHHSSNWVHRNAGDTTIVHCWNDSMSTVHFPPGSMGMMMPESIYCSFEVMCLDSMPFHHDSTFIDWHRFQIGQDSMHFSMLHCDSGHGGHNQMQFMRQLQFHLRWDSTMCDTSHHGWHPTGLMGWNGTDWVPIPNVLITGNDAQFSSSDIYSAIAFIGEPASPTSVTDKEIVPTEIRLEQNYPNPFNPSTTIGFSIPQTAHVTLDVFNIAGEKVMSLVSQELNAGSYKFFWNAEGLASGVYIYKVQAAGFSDSKKLLLLR